MNLNIEAAEEMDRDPCIFMEKRYFERSLYGCICNRSSDYCS